MGLSIDANKSRMGFINSKKTGEELAKAKDGWGFESIINESVNVRVK